jgi:hypothetical protein
MFRFLMLLQVLFIGLKLGRVIDWGWGFVLIPFWGGCLGVLVLCALFVATLNKYGVFKRGTCIL